MGRVGECIREGNDGVKIDLQDQVVLDTRKTMSVRFDVSFPFY